MTTQQPKALQFADKLSDMCSQFEKAIHERGIVDGAIQELRRLRAESELHQQELASYRFTVENREARIAELEAQLAAQHGVQPVATRYRFILNCRPDKWEVGYVEMMDNPELLDAQNRGKFEMHPLYTHPTTQGMLELRKEIESITRLLPANVDCSGVWAALAATLAKQGEPKP